ncbi:MAG: SDR family oxidoreductase [Planctomycetaceae bacterium]|nr:SDR family oxidoreductase [Planctomycetaceae bacterium]
MKRRYLITGAAHRIGRALALSAARDAQAVILHYNRSRAEADELAEEIRSAGTDAFTVGADLSLPQEAASLAQRAWQEAGPIDVLINNASIFEKSCLVDVEPAELQRNMMINAFAPLLISRAFAALNAGRKAAARPVIINMLDTRISSYDREHAAYHLAKLALFHLTKMSALEFAPGVRVNGVAPGLILPPAGKDQSYLEKLKGTNPLNSTGTPEQIAEAVGFLVANEYVTGQVIYVDGGRHLIAGAYGAEYGG